MFSRVTTHEARPLQEVRLVVTARKKTCGHSPAAAKTWVLLACIWVTLYVSPCMGFFAYLKGLSYLHCICEFCGKTCFLNKVAAMLGDCNVP